MRTPIVPTRAPVRPRVRRDDSALPLLLEEEIGELLTTGARHVVHLSGARGIGKTTALAHLAAVFPGDPRLRLLDDTQRVEPGEGVAVLASVGRKAAEDADTLQFVLPVWTDDEVLEYLAAVHPAHIGSAFSRWRIGRDHDLHRWPGLCRSVVDRLATHATDSGPWHSLRIVLEQDLGQRHEAAADLALRLFVAEDASRRHDGITKMAALAALEYALLRSKTALGVLAAQRLLEIALEQPRRLVMRLDWQSPLHSGTKHALHGDPDLADRVRAVAGAARLRHKGLVHSALCVAQLGHRPAHALRGDLRHAWLQGIDLGGMRIRADLTHARLDDADLRGTHFDRCGLTHASLRGVRAANARFSALATRELRATRIQAPGSQWPAAKLRVVDFSGACLDGAAFPKAVFVQCLLQGATLRGTDLSRAEFVSAGLDDADLQDAVCDEARFNHVDLRRTNLRGAVCRRAWFVRCDLSGTELPGFVAEHARFDGSDLTGAQWPSARLAGARFAETGLAHVDWQGADLRGCDFHRATFHLGSSRSGLVDSTIASEGSRTGFYTDESLEQTFQAPEDVRKANLRNCDLRGARVEGTDFYLVDLRGANITSGQRAWLRRCRAILDPDADQSA